MSEKKEKRGHAKVISLDSDKRAYRNIPEGTLYMAIKMPSMVFEDGMMFLKEVGRVKGF